MAEPSNWRNIQVNIDATRKLMLTVAYNQLQYSGQTEGNLKEIIHLLMIGSHAGRIGNVDDTI